ncbi:MAG: class I SAM-dependent methyltransferase [Lachnospiraceae bacterium]|nr:class I SAM-dependent methyltransferase [Lachnospiraceae bacterium]
MVKQRLILNTLLSWQYALLGEIWLGEKGINPRDEIGKMIPDKNCKILDMCCGTLSNGLPIAKSNPNCKVYGIDKSKGMLREAKRKNDIRSKIKYAPLYMLEALNCKDFKEFYNCNIENYFDQNGFQIQHKIHCNYSSVMVLSKK